MPAASLPAASSSEAPRRRGSLASPSVGQCTVAATGGASPLAGGLAQPFGSLLFWRRGESEVCGRGRCVAAPPAPGRRTRVLGPAQRRLQSPVQKEAPPLQPAAATTTAPAPPPLAAMAATAAASRSTRSRRLRVRRSQPLQHQPPQRRRTPLAASQDACLPPRWPSRASDPDRRCW